jgi:hypothetical protein
LQSGDTPDEIQPFLCQISEVGQSAGALIGNRATNFVDLLTTLFEKIAKTIDDNEPLVETHYGEMPVAMPSVTHSSFFTAFRC